MTAGFLVARREVRRRLGSLVVIGLLVAVVTAAISTALAGAHRTSTSVERFRSWARATDGTFQTDQPIQADPIRRTVEKQPETVAVSQHLLVNAFFDGEPLSDIAILSDPEGRYGVTVDRPIVLAGRMPRRNAPDEIILNSLAARLLHAGPGTRLTAKTWSLQNLEDLFADKGFPGFEGPKLSLRVVGIARMLDGLPGDVVRTSPYGLGSPGFLAAHPDVGVWPPALVVRTRDGVRGFNAVARAVARANTGSTGFPQSLTGQSVKPVYLEASQRAVDSSAAGLVVLAIAVTLAGALVIGQAVQRHIGLSSTTARYLSHLGMTRLGVGVALALPVFGASLIGTALGTVGAAIASQLLPIGLAARAEIDPGIHIDATVLILTAIGMTVAVAGFAVVPGWRAAARPVVRLHSRRPPFLTRLAIAGRWSTAGVMGVHLATQRSTSTRSVPIRTAFLGLAIAIAAVVGAGVIVQSDDAFTNTPARWGRAWHSEPDAFGDLTHTALERRLRADPRLEAVARLSTSTATIAGRTVQALSLQPVRGHMAMTVRRGRLPRRPDEVALGEQSLADAHARVGASVPIRTRNGRLSRVRVTGTVVIPPTDERALNLGAVFAPGALRRYVDENPLGDYVIRYHPDAHVGVVERRLAKDYDLAFNAFTEPQVPGSVRNLTDTRDVALAVALFFAALGTLSLFHVLIVTTRRRGALFAVLRVLGFRRRQVRTAVLVQAAVLAIAALVVGLPVGLVVGRATWRAATNHLGALTDPVTPWVAVFAVMPITLAAAAAAAWWPGRRIATSSLTPTLRSE